MRLPNNNISSTVKVTQNLYAFLTLVASVSIPVALCDADNALGAPDDANYDANYDESQVPAYTLPDPLVDSAGTPVRTPAEWPERRRPEILKLFEVFQTREVVVFKILPDQDKTFRLREECDQVDLIS